VYPGCSVLEPREPLPWLGGVRWKEWMADPAAGPQPPFSGRGLQDWGPGLNTPSAEVPTPKRMNIIEAFVTV
jgi:hypothetical protein